jgi:hypothetical protein
MAMAPPDPAATGAAARYMYSMDDDITRWIKRRDSRWTCSSYPNPVPGSTRNW